MPLPGRDGDLAADLAVIIAWKPDFVISLVEPEELAKLGLESLPEHLRIIARQWLALPIPDYGIPSPEAPVAALLTHLAEALQAGGAVLVHCHGGRGRSGMIAAALLARFDTPATDAIGAVRAARPGAIETAEQESWIGTIS